MKTFPDKQKVQQNQWKQKQSMWALYCFLSGGLCRIWKAPYPHSEVGPQWQGGCVSIIGGLIKHMATVRRVCSCANCYLQPSLSIWWSALQALTLLLLLLLACDWDMYKLKLRRFVFVYSKPCLSLSQVTAAASKQLDRDQGSPFSDVSEPTGYLFKGGIVSFSSEITPQLSTRHKRESSFEERFKWNHFNQRYDTLKSCLSVSVSTCLF